jgi:hypothetical protein
VWSSAVRSSPLIALVEVVDVPRPVHVHVGSVLSLALLLGHYWLGNTVLEAAGQTLAYLNLAALLVAVITTWERWRIGANVVMDEWNARGRGRAAGTCRASTSRGHGRYTLT